MTDSSDAYSLRRRWLRRSIAGATGVAALGAAGTGIVMAGLAHNQDSGTTSGSTSSTSTSSDDSGSSSSSSSSSDDSGSSGLDSGSNYSSSSGGSNGS